MQKLGEGQKCEFASSDANSTGDLVAEREDMEIVFVHWRILKGREEKFLDYWKTGLPVNDRKGLVGEFLSQPSGHEKYNWITWDLRSSSEETTFINVGMWADPDEFHDQIGRYFNPAGGKLSFEFEIRKRALLTPQCWRMGDWKLPTHDSEGVL
jgi:hypothetical protein